MLQNCLIGPICLCLLLANITVGTDANINSSDSGYRIKILWQRFPKFVLGFLFTTIVVTFLDSTFQKQAIDICLFMSSFIENFGFVSIGLKIFLQDMIKSVKIKKLIPFYLFASLVDAITSGIAAYYSFQNVVNSRIMVY